LDLPTNGLGSNGAKIDAHPHKVVAKDYGHLGFLFEFLPKIKPHINQDLNNWTNKVNS